MEKKLIRKTITQILSMKHFRKDKKYLIEDKERITSLNEFRNFQRLLEKIKRKVQNRRGLGRMSKNENK